MLIKTKGIILKLIKYRETSIISTIFTTERGIISVIANNVRHKNSKSKIALFQPLSLVDLLIYYSPRKKINRVSEISCYHPLHSLREKPEKSAIAIFINELLNKCLKEEGENLPSYNFIQNSMIHLNEQDKGVQNFHLIFLVKFTLFLGIKPYSVFDFTNQISNSTFYMSQENKRKLDDLLVANYNSVLLFSNNFRSTILIDLLEYYQIHLAIGKINSIEILRELFH